MIFREIKKEDIPFLVSSSTYDFKDGWSKELLESAFMTERFGGLIVSVNNEDVGYITFDLGLGDADIEEVFVLPDRRKEGIAYSLMKEVFSYLQNKGVTKIFLEVRESNCPARALYEKCGFNKINERKKYYRDGENAIVYLKEF